MAFPAGFQRRQRGRDESESVSRFSEASLPAELDSLSPSDESLLGDAEPSAPPSPLPSPWRWLCCCDACGEETAGAKRGACEKVTEARPAEVLCFEEASVKSLLLPACQPPEAQEASEKSLASFPVASAPQRESLVRRNTVDDANAYAAFDSGLGPFLSSLKTNKRKVVRSSEFRMCIVCGSHFFVFDCRY